MKRSRINNFEKFLNENKKFFKTKINENTNKEKDLSNIVKVLSETTKERTIESKRIIDKSTYELGERGAELNNKEVMAKKTEDLNLKYDSQRLEYTWRAISNDLNKALKEGNIVKDGKTIATNIKKIKDGGDNIVVYDFLFLNKDSHKYTDGVKPELIRAGIIKEKIGKIISEPTKQVWVITQSGSGVSLEPLLHHKQKFFNKKRALLEAGYSNIGGQYSYKLTTKGKWVNVKYIKQEDFNSGKYRFDVQELYKKYDIKPS